MTYSSLSFYSSVCILNHEIQFYPLNPLFYHLNPQKSIRWQNQKPLSMSIGRKNTHWTDFQNHSICTPQKTTHQPHLPSHPVCTQTRKEVIHPNTCCTFKHRARRYMTTPQQSVTKTCYFFSLRQAKVAIYLSACCAFMRRARRYMATSRQSETKTYNYFPPRQE